MQVFDGKQTDIHHDAKVILGKCGVNYETFVYWAGIYEDLCATGKVPLEMEGMTNAFLKTSNGKPMEDMDEDQREELAVLGAIVTTIAAVDGTAQVELNIEALYEALQVAKVSYALYKLSVFGFCSFDFDKCDEFGLPVVTISKDQMIHAAETFDYDLGGILN